MYSIIFVSYKEKLNCTMYRKMVECRNSYVRYGSKVSIQYYRLGLAAQAQREIKHHMLSLMYTLLLLSHIVNIYLPFVCCRGQ